MPKQNSVPTMKMLMMGSLVVVAVFLVRAPPFPPSLSMNTLLHYRTFHFIIVHKGINRSTASSIISVYHDLNTFIFFFLMHSCSALHCLNTVNVYFRLQNSSPTFHQIKIAHHFAIYQSFD